MEKRIKRGEDPDGVGQRKMENGGVKTGIEYEISLLEREMKKNGK